MTRFSAPEQILIDEAVRSGGEIIQSPWMQGHRLRAVKREVERIRATMPQPPKRSEPSGTDTRYKANRRVKWPQDRFAIHEAGPDGLPICQLTDTKGQGFRDPAHNSSLVHLGPGPVTCGHCARARST